jgi:RND family efflux transporter MFP subunit
MIPRNALKLLVLAACAVLASSCAKTQKVDASAADAPTTGVVKVTRGNLGSQLEIASEFLPYQEISVFAKVSGYIQKLYVDWGTHVKEGQLLAVLEIPELEQQMHQDEALIHKGESDVQRAQEELSRYQSEYNVAHLNSTRLAGVQKTQPGLVAQQDIDNAQGKDVQADAEVSAAKDFLAAANQNLLAAEAALEKDKALYGYARITAPFDGVVTEIDAYKGALLPAGTSSNLSGSSSNKDSLCRLAQNNLLRLVIPLPERAVPDVHMGETISVDVSGLHRTFPGKIVRFSDQIDTQTRTMHTEVEVPNPRYELVPGMYASVQIPLHTVQNVLTLPVQAVQPSAEGLGTVLVVNKDNRIETRSVTLGLQTANSVEIVSGVQEGELAVMGEQSQYKTGELVKPTFVTPAGVE